MAAVPTKDVCSGVQSQERMTTLLAANGANDTALLAGGFSQITHKGKEVYVRTLSGTKHLQCDALDIKDGVI